MYCHMHGSHNCGCFMQQQSASQLAAMQQMSGINQYYDDYIRKAMREQQHQQLRHELMYGASHREDEKAQQTRAYHKSKNKKLLLLLRR